MPKIARYFIKSGIVFMVLSLATAVLVSAPEAWNLPAWTGALQMTHFHLFVVGWITQIIFGVALWFFPKYSRDAPRGPAWIGWASFGALNIGLIARAITETAFAAGFQGAVVASAMTAAALLQLAAAVLFAVAIWPRVKPRGK